MAVGSFVHNTGRSPLKTDSAFYLLTLAIIALVHDSVSSFSSQPWHVTSSHVTVSANHMAANVSDRRIGGEMATDVGAHNCRHAALRIQ